MSRKIVIIVISILIVLSITASIVGYINKDKYNNDVIDIIKENANKSDEISKTEEEKTEIVEEKNETEEEKNETEEEKTETLESESNINENYYVCLDEEESNDKIIYKIKLVENKENCSNKSIEFKSKGKIKIINDEEDNNYYDGSILVYTEEGKVKIFDAINNKYYSQL